MMYADWNRFLWLGTLAGHTLSSHHPPFPEGDSPSAGRWDRPKPLQQPRIATQSTSLGSGSSGGSVTSPPPQAVGAAAHPKLGDQERHQGSVVITTHPCRERRDAEGGVGDFVTIIPGYSIFFLFLRLQQIDKFLFRNKNSSFSNWCRVEKNRRLRRATTFLQSKWSRSNPLCFIWKNPLTYPNIRVN